MRSLSLTAVLALCLVLTAYAEIPQMLGYQGRITDNSGIPVDDDTYTMRFRICTAPTGGTVVWDSGDMSVTTSGGVFSVNLGETPQPTLDIAFDQDYWMLVTFEGENQTPRKPLGSVGYAYMASGVVPGTEVAGDFYVDGKLGVGTNSPGGDVFHVKGGSSGGTGWSDAYDAVFENDAHSVINLVAHGQWNSDIMFSDTERGRGSIQYKHPEDAMYFGTAGVGDRMYVGSDGSVGIATTTPGGRLEVGALSGYPTVVLDKAIGQPSIKSTGGYLIFDSNGSAAALNWYSSDDVILAGGGGHVGIGTTLPGADLDVDGTAQMTGFSMPPGASAGHVLTSDASGVGTWQAPSAVSDGDWTVSGSHMYSAVSGNVGVGMTTPAVKLDVAGSVNTDSLYRIEGDIVLATTNNVTRVGRGAGANSTSYSGTFVGFDAGLNNSSFWNTFVGDSVGVENTTGYGNAFLGYQAGASNTTGRWNTFVGGRAGSNSTTGELNTLIGYAAGNDNTTGDRNTFVGGEAGGSNTEGRWNTFLGCAAGCLNTTGDYNTFVGLDAGRSNDGGDQNTFVGRDSGKNNTWGNNNTFVGNGAGVGNTTGSSNTFVGRAAGSGSNSGYENTFVGVEAGRDNTTGVDNTFLGSEAGRTNKGGYSNTFVGSTAGWYNTEGTDNTFVGFGAGHGNSTGRHNTFVGRYAGYNSMMTDSCVFVGASAGHNEMNSNRLYIENSDAGSSGALVYGEFDNDVLALNAKVGIGTTTPGGKALHVKAGSSGGTGWSSGYDAVFENDDHSVVNIVAPNDKNSEVVFSDDARFRGSIQYKHGEDAMYFGTAGIGDRMYIGPDGSVGIGSTSPGGRLQVGALSGYPTVVLDRAAAQPSVKGTGGHLILDSNGSAVGLNWYSSDDVILGNGGGNVGVGLTDPNQKLYVRQDSLGLSYPLKVENKHTVANEAAVGILFSTGGSGGNDRGKGAVAYEYTSTWNRGSFHILQDSGANSDNPDLADAVVTVDNDGEVGVGTTNPARKLHVNDVMRLEPRSSAPASPSMGDIYMDSGTRKLMVYDGSNWQACW